MIITPEHPPARLIALTAGIAPSNYLLEASICTLGRSPLCHVVVRHALVSRHHARIERCGALYVLVDTGSANGTFVNREPLAAPRRLHDRDIIGLGSAMAVFEFLHCSDAQPILVAK